MAHIIDNDTVYILGPVKNADTNSGLQNPEFVPKLQRSLRGAQLKRAMNVAKSKTATLEDYLDRNPHNFPTEKPVYVFTRQSKLSDDGKPEGPLRWGYVTHATVVEPPPKRARARKAGVELTPVEVIDPNSLGDVAPGGFPRRGGIPDQQQGAISPYRDQIEFLKQQNATLMDQQQQLLALAQGQQQNMQATGQALNDQVGQRIETERALALAQAEKEHLMRLHELREEMRRESEERTSALNDKLSKLADEANSSIDWGAMIQSAMNSPVVANIIGMVMKNMGPTMPDDQTPQGFGSPQMSAPPSPRPLNIVQNGYQEV